MSVNESSTDRIIRAFSALVGVIVALAIGAGTVLGIVLLAVSAILLVTAAVGFCPLYRILGIHTNRESVRTGLHN